MHGFCGILGLDANKIDKRAFAKSINLVNTMQVHSVIEDDFFSSVSFLDSSPLKSQRVYQSKDLIYLFVGDLIGVEEIPWKEVETNFLQSNFEWFSTLQGLFAFAIFDKKLKQISLISDHRAQLPVYYGIIDDNIVFSTDLSTFTTLKNVPEFNVEWLYEYMFFNYPIDRTTFFKEIKRIRPMTILNIDLKTLKVDEFYYGKLLKKAKSIKTGRESLDLNIKAFKEIIPKYYSQDGITLAAISGGFDSRTLLSLAPKKVKVKSYTYGVEDSGDLETVSSFINKLGIKHEQILFNDDFKDKLPDLIYDTVRLSGGTQPILRSTLLYVYKSLYQSHKDVSIIMGGINGDFFRGISFSEDTSVLPFGMNQYFKTGKVITEDAVDLRIFKNNSTDFKEHIYNTIKGIEERFEITSPKKPESIMYYIIYEEASKYFSGEMAIASNYFTFRQPFWDMDLINNAFKTDCGHLGYFKRLKEKKDTKYKQYILQTRVIASNPKFKRTYINGLPITLLAYGNETLIKISRFFIRGLAYLKGYRPSKNNMEEWDDWFNIDLKNKFDKLLNERSLILDYIDKDYMISVKKSNDIHLLNKLVTTEIILNLIKDRWDL